MKITVMEAPSVLEQASPFWLRLRDHILERCQFEDRVPVVDVRHVFDAAHSLVVEGTPPKPEA